MHTAQTILHMPNTPPYAEAIRLWNGAVDRRPAMVVQPASTAEVAAAVQYARANGLPISVRGGGHDWAGRSLVDKGLVIDLSRMTRVDVDPTRMSSPTAALTSAS